MLGKKLALKAGKWAAKKGAKNVRTKAASTLEKAARIVRGNPQIWYIAAKHDAFGIEGGRTYTGTERGARAAASKIAKAAGHGWKACVKEPSENPGYDHAGASFDLFGGESRRLPKKVSEFHRPRVRVRGGTMTLAEGSPFKGRVEKVNPAPRVVVSPLRVELTATEAKRPRAELVRKILQEAKGVRAAWDHVEVTGPSGAHLFDIIP